MNAWLGVTSRFRTALYCRAPARRFAKMAPSHTRPKRSLLLLPPAPSPPTFAALKAAYNACLFIVHQLLSHRGATVLDIALPCPHLYGHLNLPRAGVYTTTQTLVANLYKLMCVIAAQGSSAPESAEGVDSRIVLVAYPRDGKFTHPSEDASAEEELRGPVIEISTLARCSRTWETVYAVESEEGEGVLRHFLSMSQTQRKVQRVRGGIVQVASQASGIPVDAHTPMDHFSVAVGGTFDHLHIGHKLLLTMFAFVLSRRPPLADTVVQSTLTIGITGDELLKNKKYAEVLESWNVRQAVVHDFLSSLIHFGDSDDQRIVVNNDPEHRSNGRAVHTTYPSDVVIKYVEIMDPFGPTITDESISALVISQETRSGGKAVNDKRKEKGWGALEVFEVDVLDASEEEGVIDATFKSKLSSTEIRRNLMPPKQTTSNP